MNSNKPSFLDRGTIISLLIVALAYFGWMQYMRSKAPVVDQVAATPVGTDPAVATGAHAPGVQPGQIAAGTTATTATSGGATAAPVIAAPATETFTDYSSADWSFQISSNGMGLKNIDVKGYRTRDDKPIVLGDVASAYPFATHLAATNEPVHFAVEKVGDGKFVGRASVNGATIEKTLEVNSSNYSIQSEVKVTGADASFKGLATVLSEQLRDQHKANFLSPTPDLQNWFVLHEGKTKRQAIDFNSGLQTSEKNVSVLALNSHYFAVAIADHSPLLPTFDSKIQGKSPMATGSLIYQPVTPSDVFQIKYTAFAGPKSFNLLLSIDENLGKIVDYGMFAVIAKPILWLLKFLFSFFGNWGWAIIVLTLIVRLMVLPFNVMSYKSMKVMQAIQPEMTRIRERYKDKPPEQKMQMNQEIMELMKRNKANPLGGCLPMLIQLPVFFALYQVLGQSIELYRAPFIFWIHDLSASDPFFVLPILMGITMFVQQKITPTTMDPQQAKIMMWVPLIFSAFMLTLPSGLTLYIFISTLFGIIQQYIFMRDRTRSQAVKAANA